MLVVVFGAGASFDADPVQPERDAWRPPLTNEIVAPRASFGEALDLYQRCVPLIAQLRNLPAGSSLEERLDYFQEGTKSYPAGLIELAAFRFYLRYVTWKCGSELLSRTNHVTNYVSLLAIIDRWSALSGARTALVTFNYDTLLEDACRYALRLGLRQISDYITESDRYLVLKLHGSWNWVRRIKNRVDGTVQARELIRQMADIELTNRYEIWDAKPGRQSKKGPYLEPMSRNTSHSGAGKYYGVFPAIALPLRSKSGFDCPAAQVEALEDVLAQATGLLSIGWRAQEEHFLAKLRSVSGEPLEVHIVTGSATGGRQVRDRLGKGGVAGNFSFFPGGFTDYVRSSALETLLESLAQQDGGKRPKARRGRTRRITSEAADSR